MVDTFVKRSRKIRNLNDGIKRNRQILLKRCSAKMIGSILFLLHNRVNYSVNYKVFRALP